jgi:hypothetical protein
MKPSKEEPMTDEPTSADDPYGGHEFSYELDTDLYRCVICRSYEVTVRTEDAIEPCKGPVSGPPMTLNAF